MDRKDSPKNLTHQALHTWSERIPMHQLPVLHRYPVYYVPILTIHMKPDHQLHPPLHHTLMGEIILSPSNMERKIHFTSVIPWTNTVLTLHIPLKNPINQQTHHNIPKNNIITKILTQELPNVDLENVTRVDTRNSTTATKPSPPPVMHLGMLRFIPPKKWCAAHILDV